MGTQIQRRRGTTLQHASFTGALGEVTVDTDKDTLVVHDGSTAGGFPLVKENDLCINVQDYGATGDGTTDDQPYIALAIAAAIATNVKRVYFPTPTVAYQVENTIGIEGKSGLTLFGDGYSSYIRAKVFSSYPTPITATQGVITIGNTSASDNITLRGLRISAQGDSQPVDPGDTDGEFNTLSLRECSYITIDNCTIEEGARDTIYMAGKAAAGVATSDLHHIQLSNLHITGSANRRALSVVDAVEDLVGNNIIIEGTSAGTSLGFEPGSGKRKCNRIHFSNVIINGGTSNILFTSTADNNVPEDISLVNFHCRGATGDALNMGAFKRVSLTNFEVVSPGGDGIETGTVSARTEDLRVNNLRLESPTGRGIWLRALNRGSFKDVHITTATSVGIQISSVSSTNYSRNINLNNFTVEGGSSNGMLIDEYATNIFINNARVEDNNSDGLMISSPQSSAFVAEVRGGYFADNNGSGIRTNYPASFAGKTLIEGVVSTNTASGNTQAYGVELDADADYVRLLGCDLRGNNSGAKSGTVGANGVDANNIT